MADTVKSYSEMLRRVLGDRLAPDAESFFDMVAPDGVVEFPFAPPGFSKRLVGHDALAAHLKRVGGRVEFHRMGEPTVHRTVDPDLVIIEFEGFGRGIATGQPYHQTYIAVIRMVGEYIAHIREYWNPLEVFRTLKSQSEVEEFSCGIWPE